jgi:hypothetical protein
MDAPAREHRFPVKSAAEPRVDVAGPEKEFDQGAHGDADGGFFVFVHSLIIAECQSNRNEGKAGDGSPPSI